MTETTVAETVQPSQAQQTDAVKPIEQTTQDAIPRTEFEHVMSDLHKQKQRARELEDKLKQFETQRLKEQQDWKSLAEQYETEAKQAKDEVSKIKEGLVIKTKFDALRQEALKNGLHESALEDLRLLEWPDVRIETTSEGRVNVLGAERAIQRLKTQKPYLFKSPSVPNVNVNSPGVVETGEVTFTQIYEAEKAAKKSGDYKAYRELLSRYQSQKQ